ncbi:MAG: GNAT family N-acetyltransferase [Candidatus Bathyarchaeia archaeon]|jgi:ribosomal protein S18 acetylase RimI-like enzyme
MIAEKEIIVREANSKDAEGIAKVLMLEKLGDEPWGGNRIFVAENLQKRPGKKQFVVLVAESNSSIVGFVDCAIFPSFWEGEKQGLMIDFFVQPACQNRGIGSKLLEAIIKHADAENIAELHVSTERKNQKARNLYNKFGFTEEHLLLERAKKV